MLRAIAGRLGAKEHTGTVQYNGHEVSSFCVARSAAFVAQTDSHIANLTSRETVAFAYDAQVCLCPSRMEHCDAFLGALTWKVVGKCLIYSMSSNVMGHACV